MKLLIKNDTCLKINLDGSDYHRLRQLLRITSKRKFSYPTELEPRHAMHVTLRFFRKFSLSFLMIMINFTIHNSAPQCNTLLTILLTYTYNNTLSLTANYTHYLRYLQYWLLTPLAITCNTLLTLFTSLFFINYYYFTITHGLNF